MHQRTLGTRYREIHLWNGDTPVGALELPQYHIGPLAAADTADDTANTEREDDETDVESVVAVRSSAMHGYQLSLLLERSKRLTWLESHWPYMSSCTELRTTDLFRRPPLSTAACEVQHTRTQEDNQIGRTLEDTPHRRQRVDIPEGRPKMLMLRSNLGFPQTKPSPLDSHLVLLGINHYLLGARTTSRRRYRRHGRCRRGRSESASELALSLVVVVHGSLDGVLHGFLIHPRPLRCVSVCCGFRK